MSDEAEAVETVLAEHEPRWWGTGYGGGRMVCYCGDDCEDGWVAHVEPFIAGRIAQAEAKGAAEAYQEAADYVTPKNWTGPPGTLIHLNQWLDLKATRLREESP